MRGQTQVQTQMQMHTQTQSQSQSHQLKMQNQRSVSPAVSSSASSCGPDLEAAMPQLSRKFVARRISEGETGRLKEELKCQACGKGYKHVSSLAKHLWEHTPEWSTTSKLLISKHQQVQLLEAASILVSMNEEEEEDGEEYNSDGFIKKLPKKEGDDDLDLDENEDDDKTNDTERSVDSVYPSAPSLTNSVSPAPESSAIAEDSPSPTEEHTPSTPHREIPIPITSQRSISKGSYSFRRRLSSISGASPAIASSLLSIAAQASPLPESSFKDRSHLPPSLSRRRESMLNHTREEDDDDLQEPEKDGFFGDME